MVRIKEWIIAFLSGALLVSISILIYLLKTSKPIINTDSYIESLEQSVKKLKQSGENNNQNIKGSIDLSEPKQRKFLGIFKRKKVKS